MVTQSRRENLALVAMLAIGLGISVGILVNPSNIKGLLQFLAFAWSVAFVLVHPLRHYRQTPTEIYEEAKRGPPWSSTLKWMAIAVWTAIALSIWATFRYW